MAGLVAVPATSLDHEGQGLMSSYGSRHTVILHCRVLFLRAKNFVHYMILGIPRNMFHQKLMEILL